MPEKKVSPLTFYLNVLQSAEFYVRRKENKPHFFPQILIIHKSFQFAKIVILSLYDKLREDKFIEINFYGIVSVRMYFVVPDG